MVRGIAALRRVVWFNLIGALFLPVGMAQADGGPVGWLVGLGSWAGRMLGFCVAVAVLRAVAGPLQWQSVPAFLGVATLLALLAAMLVLASSVAA
jgi:formate hydrogenlyase subunit 4